MEDRLKKVMSAVFEIPVEDINDESSPHAIESWDSLKHMNLVLALEEEFNIEFEDSVIETLISYSMIAATIKSYME